MLFNILFWLYIFYILYIYTLYTLYTLYTVLYTLYIFLSICSMYSKKALCVLNLYSIYSKSLYTLFILSFPCLLCKLFLHFSLYTIHFTLHTAPPPPPPECVSLGFNLLTPQRGWEKTLEALRKPARARATRLVPRQCIAPGGDWSNTLWVSCCRIEHVGSHGSGVVQDRAGDLSQPGLQNPGVSHAIIADTLIYICVWFTIGVSKV